MDNNSNITRERHTTKSVRESMPSTNSILGVVFGIFMVIVYVGMGVLLFVNFFNWTNDWSWTRWPVGAVLIIYGVYRGYRTYLAFRKHDSN